MRHLIIIVALFVFNSSLFSQSTEKDGIKTALINYIEGTSYNRPEVINKAFYPEANLYLEKKDKEMWIVPISKYSSWFGGNNYGKFSGRVGKIISIDNYKNIATAKVEILLAKRNKIYIDMFLLKKLEGKWKIISKTAGSENTNKSGDKILFIVSNAHYYGKSDLKTGNSFSEIVNAYDTFVKAGYYVDFVSPEGESIPLAYIDTSDPLQKEYLYNQDFMYSLKNTMNPSQVDASNYKAVHYIGGGSAMFGVPENKEIQEISMIVYEEYNGIISSVCHGTAGIVNLKTKYGKYLVEGKTVNGYPDSYERKGAEYLKYFPFMIQETIEKRGGTFNFSPRNEVHVESQDNVITGQNYLSSRDVALEVIKIIEGSM